MKNKNILIGITGGIAAYKILTLISMLVKNGYSVKTILTENALNFITPLTAQTLSNNEVFVSQFPATVNFSPEHIALADWADIFIIAPATANTIAKLANGIADNLLTSVFLAFKKDIIIAPAMNTNMLNNPATQKNLESLKARENIILLSTAEGYLACGKSGVGRMQEPEILFKLIELTLFHRNIFNSLLNKKVLITAGATREHIDPVRFISNASSGKQAAALAECCAVAGADITFVCGETSVLPADYFNKLKIIKVISANDMFAAVKNNFDDCDIFISVAAVADYAPVEFSTNKLKKKDGQLIIALNPTTDILSWAGKCNNTLAQKKIIVGFAAESEDIIKNAELKLQTKNCDLIIANNISAIAADKNEITIIGKNEILVKLPETSKLNVAAKIVETIAYYNRK